MKPTSNLFESLLCSLSLLTLASGTLSAALAENEGGRLTSVGSVTRDDLQGVVCVTTTADGKHLYAAGFHQGTVTVFQRDQKSGGLTHVQTVQDGDNLGGVTNIRLSPDGKFAITAAFQSGCVTLYKRNPASGELQKLDTLSKRAQGVHGLDFAIRARFSPEGKHVYVLDGNDGGITTVAVAAEGTLKWLQTNTGEGGAMAGSRGLLILPDGKRIVTANYRSDTVVSAS